MQYKKTSDIIILASKRSHYADVAEWQTHKTQNLAEVTSCGFKSHYPHSKTPVKSRGLTIRDIYFSYYFCYYVFVRSRCFFFYTKSTNRRFYFLPLVLNFHQSRFFLLNCNSGRNRCSQRSKRQHP